MMAGRLLAAFCFFWFFAGASENKGEGEMTWKCFENEQKIFLFKPELVEGVVETCRGKRLVFTEKDARSTDKCLLCGGDSRSLHGRVCRLKTLGCVLCKECFGARTKLLSSTYREYIRNPKLSVVIEEIEEMEDMDLSWMIEELKEKRESSTAVGSVEFQKNQNVFVYEKGTEVTFRDCRVPCVLFCRFLEAMEVKVEGSLHLENRSVVLLSPNQKNVSSIQTAKLNPSRESLANIPDRSIYLEADGMFLNTEFLKKMRFEEGEKVEELSFFSETKTRCPESLHKTINIAAESLTFIDYALLFLPILGEECSVEELTLEYKQSVYQSLLQEENIPVYGCEIRNMTLMNYSALSRIEFAENSRVENIVLKPSSEKLFEMFEKIKKGRLYGLGIGIFEVHLDGWKKEYIRCSVVGGDSEKENTVRSFNFGASRKYGNEIEKIKSISIEKIEEGYFCDYGVFVIPKLNISSENVFKQFDIKINNVVELENVFKKSGFVLKGKVERICFVSYGIFLLSEVEIPEGNIMEVFEVVYSEEIARKDLEKKMLFLEKRRCVLRKKLEQEARRAKKFVFPPFENRLLEEMDAVPCQEKNGRMGVIAKCLQFFKGNS
ncbi:MAG: uncharacterized protein A8A55_2231 [Amphiamblys sp. WSBS2006]|nr:MAG: uncharacterized protein A8A55_2231 [Amphiamblys sp. WSBS2006]